MARWRAWVGAIVLSGCGGPTDRPLPADEVADYARCDAEADCVAVLNGCCCEMVAVHRARVEEFRENFHCEESCACEARELSPSCDANLCSLVIDR